MNTANNLSESDQSLLNIVKLAAFSDDRKQKMETLIPQMTDSQKLKLLGIAANQISMELEFKAQEAVDNKLSELAKNPEEVKNLDSLNEVITKVWQNFVSKGSEVKDQSNLDEVRASLQALQAKLKKISTYANEAQDDLSKHLQQ